MLNAPQFTLYHSNNLPVLRELADNSVDAIVTDPPAGIAFMGKEWDKDKGGRDKWIEWMSEVAAECLRVMKPGGHALVWALPRTSHWTATAWENAGWEPRDRICHVFGSGFPKSTNISKQIDRMAGAEREVMGRYKAAVQTGVTGGFNDSKADSNGVTWATITAPATDAAKQWDGWGTALKPAVEDYWLFRKPIDKGLNIAQNVLKWGTGGLNIDGCRIATDDMPKVRNNKKADEYFSGKKPIPQIPFTNGGRWPAHLIHDGSEEVEAVFPVTGPSGTSGSPQSASRSGNAGLSGLSSRGIKLGHGDSGSASRFFYCSKPGKSERDAGLEELPEQLHQSGLGGAMPIDDNGNERDRFTAKSHNIHPTVKALRLMRYLCRLITPPDGLILDPFMGSGSTGCAAVQEGFRFIGIEQSAEYIQIARRRIEYWAAQPVNAIQEDDRQEKLFPPID